MTEPIALAVAIATSSALGVLFFGGLWWTVQRGLTSTAPAAWFFGSLLLRTGLMILGFTLLSRGHWDRMLACLVGFFIARLVVTWVTRGFMEEHIQWTQGAEHAP